MSDRNLGNSDLPVWKKLLYASMFVCLVMVGFLLVFSLRNKPEENYSSPLGDVTPQILVGDTIYYWAEMSYKKENEGVPGKRISTVGDSTYLPEGFTEYGTFASTIQESPQEELQIQADFPASGTVYRNPDAPEVVYILMTTDWFQDSYVRFASRDLFDGDRIAWNGTQYCAPFRKGIDTPLEALPEGAVSIGTLHFIGQDYIPQKDLETNCISDDIGMSLEGREVFADPKDSDYIYVYKSHLGSSGGYWKCPVWRESYLLKNIK